VTTAPMGHDEARDQLAALALDALDAPERARVLAHVATCSACTAEHAELRAAAAGMAIALPPAARDDSARAAAVKGRLMARVKASKEAAIVPPYIAGPKRRFGNPAAVAASMLLVLTAGVAAMLWADRDALRGTLASLGERAAASAHRADSLQLIVSDRNRLIAGLTGRDMAMVRLTSSAKREAWALMFWNRETNAWTLVAHDLPPLPAGRTYQLWLVTATSKISAGVFTPSAGGEAVVSANYELPRDALKAVAVTEEPAGGVPQPTGPFVVIGADTGLR
jgi:hypothetical protein